MRDKCHYCDRKSTFQVDDIDHRDTIGSEIVEVCTSHLYKAVLSFSTSVTVQGIHPVAERKRARE